MNNLNHSRSGSDKLVAGASANSSSNKQTMTVSMDPALLRKAVRLVHCLQKERGASCAYSVSPNLFDSQMVHARCQTDAAMRIWRNLENLKLPILESLVQVRGRVDLDVDSYEEKFDADEDRSVGEYHRILVLFNTMIGSVMHSFLLSKAKKSPALKKHRNHRRAQSSSGLIQSSSDDTFQMTRQSEAFVSSGSYLDLPALAAQSLAAEQQQEEEEEETTTMPAQEQAPSPSRGGGVNFARESSRESRTPSLLNMLECFVRLKESTGLERALLSSMFAMGAVDHRLLNDLVLEVENQFKLITELQSMRDLDGNLLLLIRQNVGLPAPMERLQSFILSEFDLNGFQQEMNVEDVWDLITVYMDKLHSLELLIVEEIECSLAEGEGEAEYMMEPPNSDINKADPRDLLSLVFASTDDLESMPAEMIKAKLMDFVNADGAALSPASRELSPPPSPPLSGNFGTSLQSEDEEKPLPSEWDINLYEIHFQRRIGRGTAGTTYLAKWSGQEVAVKVAAITSMGLDGWKTEVKSLRKLHHPNIIRLMGSVYNETPLTYCLVLEYCDGGDLHDALQKPTHSKFFHKIATDIAHGMAYLHNRGIIHRDIKPANVLLSGDGATSTVTAKVTDFGVASIEAKPEMTSETGTYRWMAPEVIRHRPYSEKADCYSYGVLLWQLITREDPFSNHSPLEAAGKVALENARPKFPKATPDFIKSFIESCWAEDPEWRLAFEEISKKLGAGLGLSIEEERWMGAPMGHAVYAVEEEDDEVAELEEEEKSAPVLADYANGDAAAGDKPKGLKKLRSFVRRVSRDYL
mmetsp:Transcript_3646/g.6119  ORF Transcript_3646/g.6119 Transcript_3646/m.6119 type:complete len:808 (+) Transcript_3646:32-2455(+)